MTAIESRRRRRTTWALVCGLIGALMLPSGLALSANSLLNSTDGNSVDASGVLRVPSTPAALLAVVDAGGLLASLQMVALAPGGIGGTIVSIPVNSAAIVGEDEPPRRLYDSFLGGGIAALASDAEGLLNVTFTASAAVTASELTPLLGSITNVTVEFDRPVKGVLGGVVTDVLPAGRQSINAEQVAKALAAIEPGAAERDRLPLLKSLWVGVGASQRSPQIDLTTTSLAADETTTTTAGTPTIDLKAFVDRVLAGQVQVWQFAGTPVDQGDANPNGLDWYALDRAEIILVTASVVPSSVSSLLASINVQIDSPFDDAALTREAVLRFMSLGVNIVLIREITDPPQQATIAAIADVALESEVTGYASVLGGMEIRRQKVPVEGVDLRLTLGFDFAAFVRANPSDGLISATTTTTAGDQ
ncbi:MAG: hypothetical protein ACO3C5_04580 [Ilumatobacteraceae bacterium]